MKSKLHTAFIFLTVLNSPLSFSQQPVKQWDLRFGGNFDDYLNSLQQTTDGGYIMGGVSYSGISGDKTQASQGGSDYWMVKTDSNGIKQWDSRFGGNNDDNLQSLQQTQDGGYILGGTSMSGISGDKTQSSQGGIDYWIVKTDANGIKQWDGRFGGTSDDYLESIQQTIDGGYVLAGYSWSADNGDKSQPSQGNSDYWIVKTDGEGIKQWDLRYGGDAEEKLFSIQQTSDNGYILGGWTFSGISGDKTQETQGFSDYWIVKTDADGVKQWDARFGGSFLEELMSVHQCTGGGYILGGYSQSGMGGDKSQDSQGFIDYWLVKTDANGQKEWDARFGGTDYDYLQSLDTTEDGGYILGGFSFSGSGGDKTQFSQGGSDYWIVKVNSSGIKQWDLAYGGSAFDFPQSIQQTSDEGFLVGGYSSSPADGDKTQNSQGGYDYWIVKTYAEGVIMCNSPSNLFTDNVTSSTAILHWDAVIDADVYKIVYKIKGTSTGNLVHSQPNQRKLTGLLAGMTYAWRAKTVCSPSPGAASKWSSWSAFITQPLRSAVETNYPSMEVVPNPVTSSGSISFSLQQSSHVTIELYDMAGKKVQNIFNEELEDGFNEVAFDRGDLVSGIYILKVSASSFIATQSIIVE